MKLKFKQKGYICILVLILFAGVFSAFARGKMAAYTQNLNLNVPDDSVQLRYPIKKDIISNYSDLEAKSAADLKTPKNINTTIEYDDKFGCYVFKTKVGEMEVGTPLTMSMDEYSNYELKQSFANYWKTKNAETAKGGKDQFSLTDIKIDIGPAEKIFGPGGVQIKTTGSAELKFGFKTNNVENPSLPEKQRKKVYFDFDEKINLNMTGKIGDKMSLNMSYNTAASFAMDQQKLKLQYQGKEDEIIKNLEAGNVSMTTGSSLIKGGAALFGVKADMQFGKLKVTTLVSQQQSQTKSVSSKGSVQTTNYEIPVDEYDENRHFFLSQYFRSMYDQWMSKMPYISSGITINRVEVWVTNKRSNYNEARNLIAFVDLGENEKIYNKYWISNGSNKYPYNNANSLYQEIVQNYPDARNISLVNQALEPLKTYGIIGGSDYEKIESARKLTASEYTLNKQLGYLSLNTTLQADEVLAVAYEYTLGGQTFQVGEFASDNSTSTSNVLYLKLLKNTAMSPQSGCWDLMMKNVYSLGPGVSNIQKDRFKLNVMYQSDTTGTYLNYMPEGNIKKQLLIKVMNLDRLDSNNEPNADGFFDFIEGYTVIASKGRIIFPVTEPFGSHLRKQIGDDAIADKYVYQELYDSTLTIARQIAEKNKFVLQGEYKGRSTAVISLGASNVPRGSVTVTAGGQVLQEGTDYTVDYSLGEVTIINKSVAESGNQINVSLEDQTTFNLQRKTMLGLDLSYAFSDNFTLGGTILNLKEKPLTTKVSMGDESISNTIWGMNTSFKQSSQWLTNMVDKLPFLNLTQPSQVSFNGEFAHLIPGNTTGGISYIDDFETAKSGINILQPYAWVLASTPYDPSSDALFPEAALVNDTRYGMNRALLAWYSIDALFTRKRSSLTPTHIKNDLEQLSNHFIREVNEREIYPNKDPINGQTSTLSTLNLAFYPEERGPYNLDVDGMDENGKLLHPEKRWGGITRKIDNSDFEAANVEYIEFWMLDPFVYDSTGTAKGGDLYFNLGEISEDILKDGKKYFENGIPTDRDSSLMTQTVWGNIPVRQSTVYAFDNAAGNRRVQDIGFNGLSTEEEFRFSTYSTYVERLRGKLNPETIEKFEMDKFSPLNDPAGDNYHYFRGSDYDQARLDVLSRYKRYNGMEGNSVSSDDSPESYDTSSKTTPDVEDINQDNTLNEYEKYFQYQVAIRPDKMNVGENFIVDKRTVQIQLRNGETSNVAWYQFKIPITEYQKRIGSISDFKTIRFIRMYMTDFMEETVLRFGTLELVRGDWRRYEQSLQAPNTTAISHGTMDVSTVNIEENGMKTPVNYVLPPHISRVIDPEQSQIRQQNEQAMSMNVYNLSPNDARAVYKKTSLDVRQYRRMQMFVHAEKLIDDDTNLKDSEMTVFIRLGSDYKNNYYEYEVPLTLTPEGIYNTDKLADQLIVWPENNMIDFPFALLTDAKMERNKVKRSSGSSASYTKPFTMYDPDNSMNRVTVMGNPSLSEIKTIMVGVRNNGRQVKSAEVWFNELRLTDFDEDGGWAARGSLNVALSDFATVTVGGKMETVGFGSVDQSVSERRMDDYYQYDVASSFELGKFFPDKAKVQAPIYLSISNQTISPKYNPLDQDIELKEAVKAMTATEKDSIENIALETVKTKSFSMSNVKVNIASKKPMPWDPANFALGYSFSETERKEATVNWETSKDYKANLTYNYTPYVKPVTPFAKMKSKSPYTKILKEISISYLPNSLSFSSDINRHYYEQQLRDVESFSDVSLPLSFQKNFYWNRDYAIRWDLTKLIKMSFSSGTQARIDEPNVPVNKKLYPDEYELWKDSVRANLLHFGRPMAFDQNFDFSFMIPLSKIPLLDWVTTSTLSYKSSYNWDRGAYVDANTDLGNTITNEGVLQVNGNFSFDKLYNKSSFLKEANKRFGAQAQTLDRKENPKSKELEKKKKAKFEKIVSLNDSTPLRISHGLDRKEVIASAKYLNGKKYPLKYKKVDHVTILIENLDTVKIRLTVILPEEQKENPWLKVAYGAARGLMSVRGANFKYNSTNGTLLPGFKPEAGELFGQDNGYSSLAPGYKFSFGVYDPSFIKNAAKKGWLINDTTVTNMATVTQNKNLQYTINIEPVRSLKIELTSRWEKSKTTQIEFMYDNMPETYTGTFRMTTVALSSAFDRSNADDNYASQTFERFQNSRSEIARRMENKYVGTRYPTYGFMAGHTLAGQPFDPTVAGISENSPDVLVAAFLAAYTGKDGSSASLNPFPKMLSALPNWKVTYDGLSSLPALRKYFKTLTLSHAYTCTYNISSYTSYSNWIASAQGSDLGFVSDVSTGNPVPSSSNDITSVTLNESFSPLFGVTSTWQNNITAGFDLKRSRNLTLSVSANQIVEATSDDYTFKVGYKFADFSRMIGMEPPASGAKVNNDLNVTANFTISEKSALLRKIEEAYTQATSGNRNFIIGITADYTFSSMLTISAYYDRQMNEPLISSSAYPVTSSDFGVSLRFSLNR